MVSHELWRDRRSGEVWAVELTDGVVVQCGGPLHWSEIGLAYLDGYNYGQDEAARIEAEREHFEPLNELDLLTLEGATD